MNNKNYTKGNQQEGLTPITSNWMHKIMKEPEVVQELFTTYGSPLNILHPDSFAKNCNTFKEVFQQYQVKSQLFYARKANKAKAFVKRAFLENIGVDTASERELEQSLELGGDGDHLVLTSAIKTEKQIRIAIQHQVPIIIDNHDECLLINKLAQELNCKARVGFRLSGFYVDSEKLYSRFGFDIEEIEEYLITNVGEDKKLNKFNVEGIHFHLDGYSTKQRSEALLQCIQLIKKLNVQGFTFRFIDIGGGILINYLESKAEWLDFDANLKKSLKGEISPVTFNNNGLGYWLEDRIVKGERKTYPYYNEINTDKFLDEILAYSDNSGSSIASLLRDHNLEIRIEPGRSLVNQSGITMAKVVHRKKDAKGQWLVGLEMNMSQMMSSSADFMLDPYVMYADLDEDETENDAVEVYFTGAYCLERDVLLKRKIKLPKLPEINDVVVFVNTAGYMMHFFETQAHLFQLATNLVYKEKSDSIEVTDFEKDSTV